MPTAYGRSEREPKDSSSSLIVIAKNIQVRLFTVPSSLRDGDFTRESVANMRSGSTSLSADICFRTCDLLAQISVGAALCCTSTR